MNGTIQISTDSLIRLIAAQEKLQSLERYVSATEYSIDREKVAAICGFELKERKENADV